MKELTVKAAIENLEAVLDFIESELEAADCPMKTQMQIAVAVEEVFVNIAHYAYNPEVGGAIIRVAVGDEITIEFEDSGAAYDPLSAPAPDLAPPAEEREIGGLGIFMAKNLVDSMEYRREGGRNILTIRKNIARPV